MRTKYLKQKYPELRQSLIILLGGCLLSLLEGEDEEGPEHGREEEDQETDEQDESKTK